MNYIDFRSDTVTKPTPAMREAMANAVVGDDVYEDDPTVKELERLAAEKLGMEAALFVASGTMGNQLAIMTHTQRGDEILIGSGHHILNYEVGAMAVLSAVNVRTIHQPIVTGKAIIENIRAENIHFPKTSCVCLENALSNGTVIDTEIFQDSIVTAKKHGLKVHIDGARIFNAAVALQTEVKDLIRGTDSIMFCLSKGLAAPIGSILAGSRDFIEKARKNRKILGGGWRQAGVIAASGIVAINDMIERLSIDHDHAKLLARSLDEIEDIQVDFDRLDINMVYFSFARPVDDGFFVSYLHDHGIKINGARKGEYRLMTHIDITQDDIALLISRITEFLTQ